MRVRPIVSRQKCHADRDTLGLVALRTAVPAILEPTPSWASTTGMDPDSKMPSVGDSAALALRLQADEGSAC